MKYLGEEVSYVEMEEEERMDVVGELTRLAMERKLGGEEEMGKIAGKWGRQRRGVEKGEEFELD